MNTIIFLHGFFASGSCVTATALKEAFEGKYNALGVVNEITLSTVKCR